MSDAVMFEEVLTLIRENAQHSREADQRLDQRLDQRFQEVAQRFKETAQRFKETDQRLDQRFKEAAQRSQEIDQRLAQGYAEIKQAIQATERNIDRVGKHVDGLAEKWGIFVENMVVPAVKIVFAKWGIPIHNVSRDVEGSRNGLSTQIDVMASNDDHVMLVEVKSSLRHDDVEDHLDRLSKFKLIFPRFANVRVHGSVAGIDLPKQVARYAYRKGLFVLAQSGETMTILNDKKFRPAVW